MYAITLMNTYVCKKFVYTLCHSYSPVFQSLRLYLYCLVYKMNRVCKGILSVLQMYMSFGFN